MFQTPLLPAVPPSHSPYPVSPGPPVVRTGGPLNLSQPSPVASMQPSPPMPTLSNSNSQSSPSPGAKDASSPQPPSALTFQQVSISFSQKIIIYGNFYLTYLITLLFGEYTPRFAE